MEYLAQHIEGLIFTAEQPLSKEDIKFCLEETFETTLEDKDLESALQHLMDRYKADEFSFEILAIGGGYQFLTKGAYHQSIGTLLKQTTKKRLSKAALETLSIVAYKQPVIKSELEKIRGVSCDYAIQKLLEKELVTIVGRSDSAGRPLLYGTSERFMDYFGLSSINDLPKPKDFKMPDEQIGEPAPIEESVELKATRSNEEARIINEDSEYKEIEELAIVLGDALAAINEEDDIENNISLNGQSNAIVDVKSNLVGEVVSPKTELPFTREALEALIVEDDSPKVEEEEIITGKYKEIEELAIVLGDALAAINGENEQVKNAEETVEKTEGDGSISDSDSESTNVAESSEGVVEKMGKEATLLENTEEGIEYTSEMPISKEVDKEEAMINVFEETTSENDLAQSMSNEARLEEE